MTAVKIKRGDETYMKITRYSGLLSGFIQKFVVHPIDTMKAKIQVHQIDKNIQSETKLTKEIFRNTIKNEGIRGFFKGVGISAVGGAPAYSLYMFAFEQSRKFLNDETSFGKTPKHFISGFVAEAVACLLYLPIDILKERLQVQSNLKIYSYKNSIDAAIQMIKQEGTIGLYRAYNATLAYFGVWSGFYFVFYEKLKEINTKNI